MTGQILTTENEDKETGENPISTDFSINKEASMKIEAANSMSIVKSVVSDKEIGFFKRGQKVQYKIELLVPNREKSQMYLEPNEKIFIKDVLPNYE